MKTLIDLEKVKKEDEKIHYQRRRQQQETDAKQREIDKTTFQIDPDESWCNLTITPIVAPNGNSMFQLNMDVKISPYPNPWSYGGMWAISYRETREEAEAIAAKWPKLDDGVTGGPFHSSHRLLKKQFEAHGLIQVIWADTASTGRMF